MANISMTDAEMLKYAIENGMIDAALVQEKIEMQKRKEILEKHPYEIWEGKDGNWRTYLQDDEKGRILRKRSTKKSIEDCIVEYYLEIEQHPCFRTVYEQWIAEKEEFEEIGLDSITRYDNDFTRFFPPDEPFCKIRLCDMTDSDLEKFIKRTIKEKKLTEKSYAMLRLIINGVFKYAKREKYTEFSISTFFSDLALPSNIFQKKIKDKSKEVFNEKEAKLLIKYFFDNPTIIHLGLILAFYSGVRVGELAALKLSDNYEKCILRICRTEIMYKDKTTGDRVCTVKEYPKTDSGLRNVIIPNDAQIVLNMLLEKNRDGEFLFMKDGKRIREARFNYYLGKACKAVGIPVRSTHKIRKTYGSKLLANDVDETIVANQIGHNDISTTRTYYYFDITTDSSRREKINNAVKY